MSPKKIKYMPHSISKTSLIVGKSQHLPNTNLHEELVMIDINKGTYINLNNTGKVIWDYIEPPILVEHLIKKLIEKYRIPSEICTADTIEYLEKMQKEGLIQLN